MRCSRDVNWCSFKKTLASCLRILNFTYLFNNISKYQTASPIISGINGTLRFRLSFQGPANKAMTRGPIWDSEWIRYPPFLTELLIPYRREVRLIESWNLKVRKFLFNFDELYVLKPRTVRLFNCFLFFFKSHVMPNLPLRMKISKIFFFQTHQPGSTKPLQAFSRFVLAT